MMKNPYASAKRLKNKALMVAAIHETVNQLIQVSRSMDEQNSCSGVEDGDLFACSSWLCRNPSASMSGQISDFGRKFESSFLSDLDPEEIKVIQTIMYTGREFSEPFVSEEEFNHLYDTTPFMLERSDLEMENMLGKIPCGQYIRQGVQKLF